MSERGECVCVCVCEGEIVSIRVCCVLLYRPVSLATEFLKEKLSRKQQLLLHVNIILL